MSEWYYARSGQQSGPVTFEELCAIARNGGLDASRDLVWTSTMKDWTPAGKVEGLFNTPTTPAAPAMDPSNPYAAPQSTWSGPAESPETALNEISPGSEPIDVVACLKRGFELTLRNFGIILLVVLVLCVISGAANFLLGKIDLALNLKPFYPTQSRQLVGLPLSFYIKANGSLLSLILSQFLSVFLSLGVTRIGLNLVSGREASLAMLFGGGSKLLPALGASILYWLMVAIGLMLLIVPGIYLALRYGQFMAAMVDRNLGIVDSFSYSSSITTNNRLNLFVLALLYILMLLAGCLAFCIGVLFAWPVILMSGFVAYRWMQYGPRAAMDHPGTLTPMLAGTLTPMLAGAR